MAGRALVFSLAAVTACAPVAHHTPPQRDGGHPDGSAVADPRPPMPSPEYTADAGPSACFPAGFRATRLRLLERSVELCGRVPGEAIQCFAIDPLAQHVRSVPDRDAPSTLQEVPEIQSPMETRELSVRGARASVRGGTLTVVGTGGRVRTVIPVAVAFHALENAVLVPWAGGRQIALVGWRAPDLGSMTLIDTATLRMQGKTAEEPCGHP